jgi:hypothetical protein
MEAHALSAEKPFHESMEKFLELTAKLQSKEANKMHLTSLESLIEKDGREIQRLMLEEHIRLRGPGNIGEAIEGSDEVIRSHRRNRSVSLKTIFGAIEIERTQYSKPGHTSLAPKEAMLNLPEKSYSHGLQRRAAVEIARGSFDEAIASIKAQTGVKLPKRQAEEIAKDAARDFDAFYEKRGVIALRETTRQNELLILSTDGKGVAMRKDDLREATKKRAENEKKLKKRLSRGEKKNAKRMAQVASVYSIESHERSVDDVMHNSNSSPAPKPQKKRVWASLEHEPEEVISHIFDEANRRDPKHKREWVVLVDGQTHQLDLIEQQIESRKLQVTIVLDLIHVVEYLWKASRCFHPEGSPEGEEWVSRYLRMILEGNAKQVAAAIRRSATRQGIDAREGVDTCANYLHNNAPYLRYDEYLARGLPIATGVIEGACRHLVKDRMDVTGARWSLKGAEAVLKLRSLHASGDWDEYWLFHEQSDYERNHRIHYAKPERLEQDKLRLIR